MIVYLDCSSGISGDMLLGAFVDLGVPVEYLVKHLKGLVRDDFEIHRQRVSRAGISATRIKVEVKEVVHSRHFDEIERLIKDSALQESVKQKAIEIFHTLYEVEAKVHGVKFEQAHLHELAATDCLVDIVGTLLCLQYLDNPVLYCSALNLGSGMVNTAHGLLPVPAPATAELLRGVPVYSSDVRRELTTPTGAVLVKHLVKEFSNLPFMTINRIGYGAGSVDLKEQPNVLRAFLGEEVFSTAPEETVLIETNIDDMNPQVYEYLIERLLSHGALDVYLTPIIMKKSRPAVILSVICNTEDLQRIQEIIFSETTTIGLRYQYLHRTTLPRQIVYRETPLGKLRYKIIQFKGTTRMTPEYEDLKRIASEHGLPLIEVMKLLQQDKATE